MNITYKTLPGAIDRFFNRTITLAALQRRVVFEEENREEYIKSLITRNVRTAIVVADISKCRAHADLVKCEKSKEVFDDLLAQGHVYLSVDGQNRTDTLERFFAGLISVGGIDWIDERGIRTPIQTATTYENLPDNPKNFLIQNECIPIDIIENQTIDQIHQTYLALNSGVPHNMMERINASFEQPSGVIRDLADPYEKMWFKVAGLEYRRMDDLKYTAQACLAAMDLEENNASPPDIEDLYMEKGSRVSQSAETQVRNYFYDMSIGISQYTKGSPKKITLAQFWSLFMALHYADQKGVTLASKSIARQTFVEKVVEKCDALMDSAKVDRGRHIQEWHLRGASGTNLLPKRPSKAHYFDGWISAFHYGAQRIKAYYMIALWLDDDLFKNEDVFMQPELPQPPPVLEEVA